MHPSTIIQLITIILLILLSAFFSSAETALTTVNKFTLRSMADSGNKRAARVLKLISNSDKLISTILIGNNIVNISAYKGLWGDHLFGKPHEPGAGLRAAVGTGQKHF